MKALWIRVEAHDVDSREISRFAVALGVSKVMALGHSTALAGAIAEHTDDGRIDQLTDDELEDWARWTGKGGRLAKAVRDHLMTEGGEFREWLDTMGKLVDRRAKDRDRKELERQARERLAAEADPTFRGSSTDVPRKFHGLSSATERNGTERNETVRTPRQASSQKPSKGGTSPRESATAGSGDVGLNGRPPAPPSRARSGTATAPLPGQWPAPLIDFLDRFYPVKGRRRSDVERQLRILVDGNTVPDAHRQPVRAHSVARLAAACATVLAESHELRDLDKAIVVLLTKLGDTTDVSADRIAAERAEFTQPLDPRVEQLAETVASQRALPAASGGKAR